MRTSPRAIYRSPKRVENLAMEARARMDNAVPAWLEATLRAAAPLDLTTLPVMQQAAVIMMMETHVKRTIYARLLEEAQDKPQIHDYHALVELGLASKSPSSKWHALTYEGRRAAFRLAQKLCAQFNIHLLREGIDTRYEVNWHCCCGWSVQTRKGDFTNSNAQVFFQQHCSDAAKAHRIAASGVDLSPDESAEAV